MRCPTVASGTSKARAISAVVRPPSARSVSATCDGTVNSGRQHKNTSANVSSTSDAAPGGAAGSSAYAFSRRRRADSFRQVSTNRRDDVVISQPVGLAGTPSTGQLTAAASSASWTASSQSSKVP